MRVMNTGSGLPGRLNSGLLLLAGFIAFAAALNPGVRAQTRYGRLEAFISRTPWIDVHAHPTSRHVDYPAEDTYPTLEPPIGRPYWPIMQDRIAVFDSLEPAALRAIYGYAGTDVTENDLPGLRALSRKFWGAGGPAGLDLVLDICGIEKALATARLHPIFRGVFAVPGGTEA